MSSALSPLSSGPPFTLLDTQPGREGWFSGARGGKRLLRLLGAIPGSLSTTFSPCGLPAVNLPLQLLKECNYFPEEPKQKGFARPWLCVCV